MLYALEKIEELDVINILKKKMYENVYIYINAKTYGLNGENISTWVIRDDNDSYRVVLYQYYSSLQIFQNAPLINTDIVHICNFILQRNFDMISANREIVSLIFDNLRNIYKRTNGYILKSAHQISHHNPISQNATPWDMTEIAKLICSDENIGGHYSTELLSQQLLERHIKYNCRNLIIKHNERIVAHVATYAEAEDIAVLGGLVTTKEFRGLGFGKSLLKDLTKKIHDDRKELVLYCYDEGLVGWYTSSNWQIVSECAKLEKIHK